ncbi:MAG: CYTH domain-containing protein [Chordicoccus sp.]
MEIERKWMVEGWPDADLPLLFEQSMRQGYLTVRPTVRIREEAMTGGDKEYVLCLKKGSGIARQEIEIRIDPGTFREIETMIGLPLIPKVRRTYGLPDGRKLEVNHVDEGQPTEFWYAEIEYDTVEEARSWDPSSCGLGTYLNDDVTDEPGQTMGAYWIATRTENGE